MVDNVHELRPRIPNTEKITVNLGYVDLRHVDLGAGRVLFKPHGFYPDGYPQPARAPRGHCEAVDGPKEFGLGALRNYSRENLEAARRAGEMLHINVLGLVTIAQDITPELPRATIASVTVLGQDRSRRQNKVNAMLNQNMISEATRLTRAGQLVKGHRPPAARMLRGESAPEPSDRHARVAPARLEPPTIDVKAKVVEEKESRRTTRVSSAPLQRKSAAPFEDLKDFPDSTCAVR